MRHHISRLFLALCVCGFWGCGQGTPQQPAKPDAPAQQPTEPEVLAEPPDVQELAPLMTEEELQAAIKEKNPGFEGQVQVVSDGRNILAVGINDPAVTDITPLAGLPLRQLDLAKSHVTDIGVLKGMPLGQLYLEDTGVRDISVLKGMPLVEFYASDTEIDDIRPLFKNEASFIIYENIKVKLLAEVTVVCVLHFWVTIEIFKVDAMFRPESSHEIFTGCDITGCVKYQTKPRVIR